MKRRIVNNKSIVWIRLAKVLIIVNADLKFNKFNKNNSKFYEAIKYNLTYQIFYNNTMCQFLI